MKKFITIVFMAIIMAMATSFTAKAQYAYQPMQVDTMKVAPNQMFNYMQIPEYRDAKERADKGRKMFWGGLLTQAIGFGAVILSADQMTSYYTEGSYSYTESSSGAQFFYAMGWIGVGVGSILEIAGVYKWVEGASTMHDLRIMYSPARIIVAF